MHYLTHSFVLAQMKGVHLSNAYGRLRGCSCQHMCDPVVTDCQTSTETSFKDQREMLYALEFNQLSTEDCKDMLDTADNMAKSDADACVRDCKSNPAKHLRIPHKGVTKSGWDATDIDTKCQLRWQQRYDSRLQQAHAKAER